VNTRIKGREGEDRAAEHLQALGWTILARNYRTRRGEVDIIALDKDELVFVEVKCWSAFSREDLPRSISRQKQRRIIEVCREYLACRPALAEKNVRFDVFFSSNGAGQWEHFSHVFTET
jgi:putative endonuclease